MLTIDRFEGELAVCEQEDGRMFTVEKALLPPDCVEGDAIEQKDGIYIKKDNRCRIKCVLFLKNRRTESISGPGQIPCYARSGRKALKPQACNDSAMPARMHG